MPRSARRKRTIAGLVILAILLAGCGSKMGLPRIRLPHPKIFYRPEMVLGIPHLSLNPLTSHASSHDWLISLMYDSLVKIQPNGTVIPDIASSWSIQHHYTTYIFHLNPHAKWWNGRPISVHDVAWSYSLYANPKAPMGHGKSLAPLIRRIHIINAGTIEIQLKYPDPAFLNNVAASGNNHPILPAFMISNVPLRHLASSRIFNKIPDMMGSGPYRPVSDNAEGITWIGNPHYFLGAPKSRALITTWANSPTPDINWTSNRTDGQSHALTYPGPDYFMLLYNSTKVPPTVAKAMPEMINRLSLAQTQSHSFVPAYQPVIPGSPYASVQPFQNPRTLLTKDGYKQVDHMWMDSHRHKVDLTIATAKTPVALSLASAIHRQLTAEGWNNRVAPTHNLSQTIATHAFTIALVQRRAAPYPLLIKEYGPHSSHNYGQYNSPVFRQCLKKISSSPNSTQATKKALTALLQSPPGVYLLWNQRHVYMNSRIQGFRLNPFDPLSGIQNWRVMPSTKRS